MSAQEGSCKAKDKADQGGNRRTSNDALLASGSYIYGKKGVAALAAATHKPIAKTFISLALRKLRLWKACGT